MNQSFNTSLANGDYNWSVNCTDSLGLNGFSGEFNVSVYYVASDVAGPNVTSVVDGPDPPGFGFYVSVNASVVDDSAVSAVRVGITPPGGGEANYSMTNVSDVVADTWSFNYTATWTNGLYAYTVYANDSSGNLNGTESGSFRVAANATLTVATKKDVYYRNEIVNLTDPPGYGSSAGAADLAIPAVGSPMVFGGLSPVGLVVMFEPVEDDGVSFAFEEEHEAFSDMHPLVVGEIPPEVLEVPDVVRVEKRYLVDLFSDRPEKDGILPCEPFEGPVKFLGASDVHRLSHHLLNSSRVMGLILPSLRPLAVSSMDLTACFATSSLTSRLSSSDIPDISAIFLRSSSSSTSLNFSENALRATEDQFIQSTCSMRFFNVSGTDKVIVAIKNTTYVCYVYSKDINKFGSTKITEVYQKLLENPGLGALVSLVRRNGAAVWSCNSDGRDPCFLELRCGDKVLNYSWVNASVTVATRKDVYYQEEVVNLTGPPGYGSSVLDLDDSSILALDPRDP
ncbi:MAG: hypothetical protein JW724_06970 [Candidatus Altiarchaeota archaeon]|nr:hypothetical protein [Candidatus Altiarchaeota archaeon]